MLSNSENINSGIGKINKMDIDMGFTNIYKALSLIFSDSVDDENPGSLILIANGGEKDPNSFYRFN